MAAGCWDRREIETLAVATAIALDVPDTQEGVLLTAQFSIPARTAGAAAGAGGGGGMTGPGSGPAAPFARTTGGPSGPTAWVVGAPGATLTGAVERITSFSPRLPFWAHLRLIVVGEEMARRGLGGVLDALLRERQFRRTPWLVVARGVPGYRILELPSPLSPAAEEGITRLLEILRGHSASVLPGRLQDFVTALAEPGIDPVVAGMTYALPVPRSPRLTPSSEQLPALPQPLGTAVFRDDRLVGWLSADESRDLVLMMGRSRVFRLTAPCPQGAGVAVLNVVRFRTRRDVLLPRLTGGDLSDAVPAFKVSMQADASLNEQTCDPPLTPDSARLLERQVSEALQADMQVLLRRLHEELRVDPLGLGRQVFRRYPRWWSEYGPRWRELLPRVPVEVEMRLFVRRTGIATGRVKPEP